MPSELYMTAAAALLRTGWTTGVVGAALAGSARRR
jgi:hypothetical protein